MLCSAGRDKELAHCSIDLQFKLRTTWQNLYSYTALSVLPAKPAMLGSGMTYDLQLPRETIEWPNGGGSFILS